MNSRTSSSTATRPSHQQIETISSTQRGGGGGGGGGGGCANRPMQIRTVDLDVEKYSTDDEMEDITPQPVKLALSTKTDPRLKLGSGCLTSSLLSGGHGARRGGCGRGNGALQRSGRTNDTVQGEVDTIKQPNKLSQIRTADLDVENDITEDETEDITPRPGQSILKQPFSTVAQYNDDDDDGHLTDLSEEEEEADNATATPSNQKATIITESPNKKGNVKVSFGQKDTYSIKGITANKRKPPPQSSQRSVKTVKHNLSTTNYNSLSYPKVHARQLLQPKTIESCVFESRGRGRSVKSEAFIYALRQYANASRCPYKKSFQYEIDVYDTIINSPPTEIAAVINARLEVLWRGVTTTQGWVDPQQAVLLKHFGLEQKPFK